MKLTNILVFLLFSSISVSWAQTQVVKGTILDAQGAYPVIGATVIVNETDPVMGAVTDIDGKFRLEAVPLGRKTLTVQFVGYKSITIPNVLVTSGKEVILNVDLEESVEQMSEIVITGDADKDLPLNDLAKVSARTFSLEEVTRFSGGRNDVARLATSFAGVSAANDSRNDIVVRGNSPVGLLWRVEGIPIATTNHFATLGTTGGPVNALNTNLLRTSDFLTGAFPAEYGNANAAVFDVQYRNGNPDKNEFTFQMSAFSGLEFMAEGPLSRKGGSFVASYRYGIASLAATGTSATPFYQDFSFKVNFPKSKWGQFQLFGLGGLSSIDFDGDETDEDDLFANPNQDAFVDNQLALMGLGHTLRFGKNTFLRTNLGVSTNFNEYLQDNVVRDEAGERVQVYRAVNSSNRENRYTFTSTLNSKFNSKWSLRAGVIHEVYDVDLGAEDRDNRVEIPDVDGDQVPDFFLTTRALKDQYNLTQVFAQAEQKMTDRWSMTYGLHSQYLNITGDLSLEPRFALSWQATDKQRWSLAYGLHAQTVPGPILFYREEISPGVFAQTNADLDFMKSHHFVLAYDRNFGSDWRLKAETYYQRIYDIPVRSVPGSYSIVNEGADFIFEEEGSLANNGTGSNIGVELTLEKFFSDGYYVLLTSSVYDSKYRGSDDVERNTAFNNNVVLNVLAGREWPFGPDGRNAWTFDTKLTTSGGNPFTPIDLEGTRANAGRQVFFEDLAFSERADTYFRWDVKFGVRLNSKSKRISHQFFIDLQNITNRENEFVRRYNEVTDQIDKVEQIGFFPDILYRIQF